MPRAVSRVLLLACLVLPALSASAAPLRVVTDQTLQMLENGLLQLLLALAGVVLLLGAWLASVRRAVRIRTRALEREQAQLRTLVESSPDLVWLKDGDGVYRACNGQTATVFGHAREDILGKRDVDLFGPETAARFARDDASALRSGGPITFEDTSSPGSFEAHVFETIKTPVRQPDGTVLGVLGVARDVTKRREQESTIREQERLLTEMSSLAQIGAWEIDLATDAFYWTEELARIYEIPAGLPVTPATCTACYGDPERILIGNTLDAAAKQGKPFTIELPMVSGAGKRKWVRSICSAVCDGGRPVKLRGTVQKDELIWRQTNFDVLTGLPNRRLFLDRLEQDLRKAQGAGQGLGVLLLDLDRFKDINDSYGHTVGDNALVEMTRRLARCVSEDATIARLGGNMFALVVGEFDGQRHLDTVADAVIGAIAEPIRVGGEGLANALAYVSASVGISVFPDDGQDAAELVRNAEQAVYLAKSAGRGRFQYFTPALQQHARDKLALTNDLRAALARKQLQVHYQPIVETATGQIRKAEALVRWFHPEHGMISPARFIPLAEEAGLIHEIGEWVLQEAIASIERWQRVYGVGIELSVNVSPIQFEERAKLAWLARVVNAGLAPNSITIEITEGTLVTDADHVVRCLDALHGAGARVSIDDFGTGFSSLSYLKHFDVDYLKIDKSFIDHLTEDGSDRALTEAIVDLAHRLGIEAIAEGVETGAQRDILAALGCDYIQGYYYSPAVPQEAFERFLDHQTVH